VKTFISVISYTRRWTVNLSRFVVVTFISRKRHTIARVTDIWKRYAVSFLLRRILRAPTVIRTSERDETTTNDDDSVKSYRRDTIKLLLRRREKYEAIFFLKKKRDDRFTVSCTTASGI